MSELVDDPGWMDILNQHWDWKSKQMWTCFPGKCIKYDSAIRQASIEVLVKYIFGEDESPSTIPNLLDVPVLMPGNQHATINLPKLGDGSLGLIVVANLDITDWILGSGQAVLPTEDRRWDINDGFFIPGVFPVAAPYLGTVDDDVLDINLTPGIKAKIGNSTAELLDLMDQFMAESIAVMSELIDLAGSSVLGGSNSVDLAGSSSTGTLVNIVTPLAAIESAVTASKVKLETIQTKLGTIKS